jgi:hypothetical protein
VNDSLPPDPFSSGVDFTQMGNLGAGLFTGFVQAGLAEERAERMTIGFLVGLAANAAPPSGNQERESPPDDPA